MSKQLGMATT